jgi:hypothetical protein
MKQNIQVSENVREGIALLAAALFEKDFRGSEPLLRYTGVRGTFKIASAMTKASRGAKESVAYCELLVSALKKAYGEVAVAKCVPALSQTQEVVDAIRSLGGNETASLCETAKTVNPSGAPVSTHALAARKLLKL